MSRYRCLIAVVATCLGGAAGCEAATLRTRAVLHGPSVRLSDLFDGLSPGQDCEIGPSPDPGKPLFVPAAQLAAIAGQFGVDWQSSNTAARAVLERPARSVGREEILAALKPALMMNGMSEQDLIDLGAFASPILPADLVAAPAVQALNYDSASGQFSAVLLFAGQDLDQVSLRVTGRVEQSVGALILNHELPPGTEIQAADVTPGRVPKKLVRGQLVDNLSEIGGLVTRQPMAAGAPVLRDSLYRPLLVVRGKPVVLRLVDGGLALTASGTVLDSGGSGDLVHVLNASSRMVLVGHVIDDSDIEIDPGSAPVSNAQLANGAGSRRFSEEDSGR